VKIQRHKILYCGLFVKKKRLIIYPIGLICPIITP